MDARIAKLDIFGPGLILASAPSPRSCRRRSRPGNAPAALARGARCETAMGSSIANPFVVGNHRRPSELLVPPPPPDIRARTVRSGARRRFHNSRASAY